MFKHWKGTLALLVAAVGVGLLWAGLALAKKPPPPPPPPPPPGPGTICFEYPQNTDAWGMDSDGSNKFLALSLASGSRIGEPSALDYGGARWWLTVVQEWSNDRVETDLYAYRPTTTTDLEWVRLTDVGSQGIYFEGDLLRARWSNDREDSFVSAVGFDWETGIHYIWRINISGAQIDTLRQNLPHAGLSDLHPIASDADWIAGGYALSPSGDQVVYLTHTGVWVKTVGGQPNLVRQSGARFDWSPDGTKIAFEDDGSVWTMNPDGTGVNMLAASESTGPIGEYSLRYYQPFWSPDSQWLVFYRDAMVKLKGRNWGAERDIVQMPAQGGQIVNLTEELDPGVRKMTLAWRPLPLAP